MDYGEVFTRAWKIIWKYKVLWIFGILGGCSGSGRGGGGGSGGAGSSLQYRTGSSDLPTQWRFFFFQIQHFFENVPTWVWILLAVVVVILVLLFIVLGTIGRIGLVRGASLGDEDAPKITFNDLFRDGLHYFWRVFLLDLLVGIASIIILAIILAPGIIFSVITLGIGLLCLFPLICLLIPLFWAIGVVVEQSAIAIVLEDLGILAGLARGWEIFKRNLGTMIVMALVLYVGGAIIGFILAIPALIALVPLFISFVAISSGPILGLPLLSAALFLVYLPFLLVLNGIVQAYIKTSWTLTFRRLTGRRPGAPVPAPPEAPSPVQEFPSGPPMEPLQP